MSSVRKKYRPESSQANKEFPVSTAPSAAPAEPPPQADDAPQLPEKPGTERDPIREAEHEAIALQQRLREMENAEVLQQEALSLQQRLAKEAQQQVALACGAVCIGCAPAGNR